jgi:hypothetical protein
MSTFTVAGVSTQYGITKVRFANDLASRVKLLSKGGHSPLELMELPKAMTKAEACQHLIDVGGVFKQWSALLNETMGKKQGTVVSKPVKAKAKAAPVKTKAVAPKKVATPKVIKSKVVEDDLELEELKQLAELEDAPI